MHNVKRFLQDSAYATSLRRFHLDLMIPCRFEPSQDARARATAEGNTRPEDMIPIYRKLSNIDSSGKETIIHAKYNHPYLTDIRLPLPRYFIVDSVEALSKFGADAWDRVVCVMTTGQAWQFRPYKWSDPRVLFHHGELLPLHPLFSCSLFQSQRDIRRLV